MMDLSDDQRDAYDAVMRWYRSPHRIFKLDGVAGSGKTALAVQIGQERGASFAAFSGKAASVLRQRGADPTTTLHQLLYYAPTEAEEHGRRRLEWTRRGQSLAGSLIVADECSMIDRQLGGDLLATGAKVLVTGDSEQLPPIGGVGFFDGEPDARLTKVHRQAADSQPLQLATAIRQGQAIRPVRYREQMLLDADIVICALNETRRRINRIIRRQRGISNRYPQVGDAVCAFANNYQSGVLNGTIWTIDRIIEDGPIQTLALRDDIGTTTEVRVPEDLFVVGFKSVDISKLPRDLTALDFGYAVTAHKAQGSEWQRVVVIDETASHGFAHIAGPMPLEEYKRRWLYTAVTRAKAEVVVMEAPR